MNYQPSQSASSDAPNHEATMQLKVMESVIRRLQMLVGVTMLAAVASYFLSHSLKDPHSSLFSAATIILAAISLVYVGRWIQGLRTVSWLHARTQDESSIDWSEIPDAGGASELRLFSSIEEAKARGWTAGPALAMHGGAEVPAWMECDGNRYEFDGLMSSSLSGFVPEELRVFGRLRFLAVEEEDEKKEGQASASKTPTLTMPAANDSSATSV